MLTNADNEVVATDSVMSIQDDTKDSAAVTFGQKCGRAGANKLTKKQRVDIAKKTALSRWLSDDMIKFSINVAELRAKYKQNAAAIVRLQEDNDNIQKLIQAIGAYLSSPVRSKQSCKRESKKLSALPAAMKVLEEHGPLKTVALHDHVISLGCNVALSSLRVMLSRHSHIFTHNAKREWTLIVQLSD